MNGYYDELGVFHADFSSIPDEYWVKLNKAIVAEVSRSFPTFADVKASYHRQLIALWLVGAASTIAYALAAIILH